jgi:hypothetical protein
MRKTPMDLLELAIDKEGSIDVIERLAKLHREEREYQARVDFDSALNGCQAQIGRIAPNQKRENGIMWADYAQLDRAIRPIYVNAGFSIGFSEVDTPDKSRLRMCATLSNRGISREYFADISRAPANSSMKQADADASAASRVKRYLMLDIFNIAIGIDKDEKELYQAKPEDLMDESIVMDFVALIEGSGDVDELKKNYLTATQAGANDPSALRAFDKAKKTTWKGKGFRA